MNRKIQKVLSNATLATVFAASSLIPGIYVTAEASVVETLEKFLVSKNDKFYSISVIEYARAENGGHDLGSVEYVVSSEGNTYKLIDFARAKNGSKNKTNEEAFELLRGKEVHIDSGTITFDKENNPIYNDPNTTKENKTKRYFIS